MSKHQTLNNAGGGKQMGGRGAGVTGGRTRMAQVNLGKGKAATSALLKAMEEGKMDVVAIQQPHVRGGKSLDSAAGRSWLWKRRRGRPWYWPRER